MNKQQIFEFVVLALYAQNRKSTKKGSHGPICAYRGKAGTKCAVGHLIPDSKYRKDLEDQCAGSTSVMNAIDPKFLDGYSLGTRSFLTELQQTLHDTIPEKSKKGQFRDLMIKAAEGFAQIHGLRIPRKKLAALD